MIRIHCTCPVKYDGNLVGRNTELDGVAQYYSLQQVSLSIHHLYVALFVARSWSTIINHLIPTLKLQSNGPLYSNTVIGTLAVDEWAVTFGTARMGMGGVQARPGPSSLYKM